MYTFHYGGQEYQLDEATDLVVIRMESDVTLRDMQMSHTSRELIPTLVPVMSFPEANVTVYRIVAQEDAQDTLAIRNRIREELNKEAGVRFAGRVLRDQESGTIFVYTENIFIKFREAVPEARCEEMIRQHGLQIREKLVFSPNTYFLRSDEGTGLKVFAIAEDLLAQPEVESCHPELVREKKEKFIYPLQWHLQATTINGLLIDQGVDVEGAWALTRGGGTIIAVIDDGFDVDHEEFAVPGKVVFPRDTVRDVDDARPRDPSERHGTACAGVACAAGLRKASGVAPEARLMPIKTGGLGSIAEAKAFAWAADRGADVISCSWGPADGPWYDPPNPAHQVSFALPDSTRLAIEYALNRGRGGRGCVICWAAGNGNEDVRFDGYASHPSVVAVAACNDRGLRCVYSDFGDAVWVAFPSGDVYAPQLNHPRPLTAGIWTTDRRGSSGYNSGGVDAEVMYGDAAGNYTATFSGTSSACPGMAGVCALMIAANPSLSWQQVKDIARRSCDQIDLQMGNYNAQGHSPYYGYGRINAARAVQNARAAAPTTVVTEPEDPFDVEGTVFFRYQQPVTLQESEQVGDVTDGDRLMGLQLRLKPGDPKLSLRYRVVVSSLGSQPAVADGAFAGTRDKRRKIIGFAAELTGPLASKYDVIYSVACLGDREERKGRNGKLVGKSGTSGSAIRQVKIEVRKKAGSR